MNAIEQELLDAELANIREQLKHVAGFNVEMGAEVGRELLQLSARVTAIEAAVEALTEKLEGAAVGCIDGSDYTVTVMPWGGVIPWGEVLDD